MVLFVAWNAGCPLIMAQTLQWIEMQKGSIMKNTKNKNSKPDSQAPNANYNPANRNFQRTEDDLDNVSKSEKDELERRKDRTAKASTRPNKQRMS